MAKYLIDASIIASSMEDFKRRFCSSESTLVLSDLTFRELEARKKDHDCVLESKKFTRFLIDLFVRELSLTEVCTIESENLTKHIDEELVKYAAANNMSILTCDKGMALWCRFYMVPYKLLERRSTANLPFIFENNGSLLLSINRIPSGYSVFVYSPEKNKIMAPVGKSNLIFLNTGNVILVAHSENGVCNINSYYVGNELIVNLMEKNLYASEDDIDSDGKPFHKELYRKWSHYMQKVTN